MSPAEDLLALLNAPEAELTVEPEAAPAPKPAPRASKVGRPKKAPADPLSDWRTQLAEMTANAVKIWRQAAEDLAAGKRAADVRPLLDAAAALHLRGDPIDRLAEDAAIIREVAQLEGAAGVLADRHKASLAAEGGRGAIAAKIKDMEAEIERLRRLVGSSAGGEQIGAARALRNRHPRLYSPAYSGEIEGL